jgi:hypothetical protein
MNTDEAREALLGLLTRACDAFCIHNIARAERQLAVGDSVYSLNHGVDGLSLDDQISIGDAR